MFKWLPRLVEPSSQVTSAVERRRARLVALLCLVMWPLACIASVTPLYFGTPGYVGHWVAVAYFPLCLLMYFLARSRHYTWGIALMIVLSSAVPYTIVFIPGFEDYNVLIYTAIGVMIASMLVSAKLVGVVAVAHLVLMNLVPLLKHEPWIVLLQGALGFGLVSMGLIMLNLRVRDAIERDRRADLTQSERFMRAVLDASPLMVGVRDADGRYVLANEAVAGMYGVPIAEVVGATDAELARRAGIDESAVHEYADLDLQVMRTGSSHEREAELAHADGERRWFHVTKVSLAPHDYEGLALSVATDVTEQRQATADLAASEERWFQLFEQSVDGIGYYDTKGHVVRFNREAARRMGGIPGDFAGKSLVDIYGEASHVYRERLDYAVHWQGTRVYEDAVEMLGEMRNYRSRYTPIIVDREVVGVLVVSTDMTELATANQALAESERRLRTLYESLAAGVVLQDRSGAIIDANAVACEILGLTQDSLLGLYASDQRWNMADADGNALSGEQHPAMVALATGEPVRDRVLALYAHDADRMRWLLINADPLLNKEGDAEQVVVTFSDITALREARSVAQASESRYRAVLESSPDGIMVTNAQGMIVEANPALARLLGFDNVQDAIGSNLFQIVVPEDRAGLASDMQKLISVGIMRDMRYRAALPNGTFCTVEGSSSMMYGADGDAVAAVTVIKDITERLAADERECATMQMFNDIVEAVPIGLYIYDYEQDPERLVLLQANPAASEMTGVSNRQAGQTFGQIWSTSVDTGLRDRMLNVMRTGEPCIMPSLEYGDEHVQGVFRVRAFAMANDRLAVAFDDVTDQARLAEERERILDDLEQSHQTIEFAQQIAGLGVARRSTATGQGIWSGQMRKVWGLAPDEPAPSLAEVVAMCHPEDRESVRRHMQATAEGKVLGPIHYRIVRKSDGTEHHVETSSRLAMDLAGQPGYLVSITRDITEQVVADEEKERMLAALARSHQQMVYAQNLAGLGNWYVDREKGQIVWSDALKQIYGLDPRDPAPDGADLAAFYHPEDRERIAQELDHGGHGRKEIRYRIVRKSDGEVRYLHAELQGAPDDQEPAWLFGVTRDVTASVLAVQQRERMLQELVRANRQLQYAQAMAKMGNWHCDPATGERMWSDSLKEMYGLDPEQPVPTVEEIQALYHPDDRQRVIKALGGGGHGREQIRFRIKRASDGQVRHLLAELEGTPEDQEPAWVLGVTRDITDDVLSALEREMTLVELERALSQLEAAEAMAKMGSWQYDVDAGYSEWSPELMRIYGLDPDGDWPAGSLVDSLFHPEDRERVSSYLEAGGHGRARIQFRILRYNDGEERHLLAEMQGSPADQAPLWKFGVTRDITDEVLAERERERTLAELREALQQLENAQRLAGVGLWRRDYDSYDNNVIWSDTLMRIWGRTEEEGPPSVAEMKEQMPPEDRDGMDDYLRRIHDLGGTQVFQFRVYRKTDGALRHVSAMAQAVAGADGEYRWLLGVARDVTDEVVATQERERFVAELQELNTQLEAGQRLAGLGWWRRQLEPDVPVWSPLLLEMWGLHADDPAPSYDEMLDMIHPDDRAGMDAFYARARSGEGPAQYTMRIYRKRDGVLRHLVTEAQGVPDERGDVYMLMGVARDLTDEIEAQDALRASEERYRLLAENVTDVIWTIDLHGAFTYVSPSIENLRGFTPQEMLDQGLWRSITPESRKRIEPLFSFVREGMLVTDLKRESLTLQLEQTRKGGGTVWTEAVVTPIVDEERRVTGFLGVSRDISERRAAQEALMQSEEKHRLLVENQSDMLVRVGSDGRYEYASLSFCAMFGKTEQELLGQQYQPLIHPDDRQAAWTAMRGLDAPPYTVQTEYRAMTAEGWRWLAWSFRSILDEEDRVIGMVGAGRDVTSRVEAERALADSESILRQVLDSDPALIFAKSDEGRFQMVNRAFQRALAAEDMDLIGQSEREIGERRGTPKSVLDRWEEEDRQVIQSQEMLAVEEVRAEIEDGERWYSVVKVPLNLPDRRSWVLGIGTDVTERRQLEEQLRQAAKMEAVGRLAGGVAHDFNNLLTVINGYSAMLLSDLHPTDALRDEINEIHLAGERAAALTRQLLAFSRRQANDERVVDLNDTLKGMRNMLARLIGEDIRLRWRLGDALWPLFADPGQIEQVVVNLSVNARDAMPDGGSLILETYNAKLTVEEAEQHADLDAGDYVVLEVTDTGVGMSLDVQQHLFEPFFTTKDVGKGTGLGLAVVYGFVTQSQGAIHVYSEPGMGTSFRIYLPRADEAGDGVEKGVSQRAAVPSADKWRGDETILFVEDEAPVRRLATSALRRHGYRVLVADGAPEARELWRAHKDEIALLLTDVIMPGESGPDLARALAAESPELPIVYVSGYSEEVLDERQLVETGARLVRKPFSPTVLARAIREMLDDAAL